MPSGLSENSYCPNQQVSGNFIIQFQKVMSYLLRESEVEVNISI